MKHGLGENMYQMMTLRQLQCSAEKKELVKAVNCGQTIFSIAPPAIIRDLRPKEESITLDDLGPNAARVEAVRRLILPQSHIVTWLNGASHHIIQREAAVQFDK